jgi:hypothetical protein
MAVVYGVSATMGIASSRAIYAALPAERSSWGVIAAG